MQKFLIIFFTLCAAALFSCSSGINGGDFNNLFDPFNPDASSVNAAMSELAIGYGPGDTAEHVTQNLTLATSGADGTAINWISDYPATVTTTGIVTRPLYSTADANITLTATVIKGTTKGTKVFNITVIKAPATDLECVADDKSGLAIIYNTAAGDTSTSVTQNLTLLTAAPSGSIVSWVSGNPAYVTNTGAVTRPAHGAGDVTLNITATITKGTASDTKVFTITVKESLSDSASVSADKDALNIIYAAGDSASSVAQTLTLPASGLNRTTISWSSSDTSVITNTGIVTRPHNSIDVTIILIATIYKGGISDTKTFTVTVLALKAKWGTAVFGTDRWNP